MTFSFFAELLAIILMIETSDPNEKICIHYSMFSIERLSCANYFITRLFVAYYHLNKFMAFNDKVIYTKKFYP